MPKPVNVTPAEPAEMRTTHAVTQVERRWPDARWSTARGFRGLFVRAHEPIVRSASKQARWWRAVSQRVPRDAYRRIAMTDAFGPTQHPGRRDAGYPPELVVSASRGDRETKRTKTTIGS